MLQSKYAALNSWLSLHCATLDESTRKEKMTATDTNPNLGTSAITSEKLRFRIRILDILTPPVRTQCKRARQGRSSPVPRHGGHQLPGIFVLVLILQVKCPFRVVRSVREVEGALLSAYSEGNNASLLFGDLLGIAWGLWSCGHAD